MKITGIIAEFNPFHNGHKYLIDSAKKNNSTHIVAVISGNFVERADSAIISKFSRAEMAVKNGVDLVLEMPVSYSISSANYFAAAGVNILKNLCHELAFGSECGNIEKIKNTAYLLQTKNVNNLINKYIKTGISYPAACDMALKNQTEIDLNNIVPLKNPNDILAVEYIKAVNEQNANLNLFTIKREGAMHHSKSINNNFASSSYMRQIILNGSINECKNLTTKSAYNILNHEYNNKRISNINNLSLAIISKILLKKEELFFNINDIGEGLDKKIIKAAQNSKTFNELCFNIKSKRYTLARIRRIILNSFLEIDKSFLNLPVPYIRVLAFNKNGEEILKASKNKNLNLVTSLKKAENISATAKKFAQKEYDAGNIYSLTTGCLNTMDFNEYKYKVLKY